MTSYLGWLHSDDSSITGLDLLWEVFKFLTGTSVNLFLKFFELAGDVSGVAIHDRRISVLDLTGVVEDNDLQKAVTVVSYPCSYQD